MIEISHLVKKYGSHVAVDDLSLTVEPGRIYGFLGPNGAGKSTTMNIVTGYLGATSGEVKIHGYDILKQPNEAKRHIGYLPEIPPLYMDMGVEEYLKFAAELKGTQKRYVGEAMELTGISDIKDRLIRNLSKGYRQRVGLAQAVLGYPDVIILDEPTVGLDPKQIIEIRELIKKLGERHTVILSSHILSEVREVCDYIFILSKGKLVASDTTENLLKQVEKKELEILVQGDGEAAKELLLQSGIKGEVELWKGPEDNTAVLKFFAGTELPSEEEEIPCGDTSMPCGDEEETPCGDTSMPCGNKEDIRNQIIREFVEAEIPILEIKSISKSLEDIFLELTDQKGGALQ